MKKFAALLFILSSTYLFSQEKILDSIYNFKLTNTDIIWQKIYTTNDSINTREILLKTLQTRDLKEFDNSIVFNTYSENIDIKKYGGAVLTTAFFVQNDLSYSTTIDFKTNKYRVTIKNITDYNPSFGTTKLEKWILKKSKIKANKFYRKNIKILDNHFSDKFTVQHQNSEW